MNMHSPLNTSTEISIISKDIESLQECNPAKNTKSWAVLHILLSRRSDMEQGTGFSAGYCDVSEQEISDFLN